MSAPTTTPAVPTGAAVAWPDQVDRRGIAALAFGHACVDTCQGAVPAIIPFLVHLRGYSYAEASALILAMTFTSSLLQPLFGHLADRRSLTVLLPGGIVVGALGIAAVGFTTSPVVTFVAVAISGLGVGAYHPEGARWANYVSGRRRATGMSLYSVGGNCGFALGPILVTPLVLLFGLHGTLGLLVLPVVATVWLLRDTPRLEGFRPAAPATASDTAALRAQDRWGPFTRVAGVAGARSVVYFGVQTFAPLFLIAQLDVSTGTAGAALTVLLVAGAAGTLVGGRVAERVGNRPILVGCMAVLTPLVLLLTVSGLAASFALMALLGFFTVGNFSTTVVLGQLYLPSRIGLASGVTLGAAIGIGGVAVALLGILADATSLTTVLLVVAVFPLIGLALALTLPREPIEHRPGR